MIRYLRTFNLRRDDSFLLLLSRRYSTSTWGCICTEMIASNSSCLIDNRIVIRYSRAFIYLQLRICVVLQDLLICTYLRWGYFILMLIWNEFLFFCLILQLSHIRSNTLTILIIYLLHVLLWWNFWGTFVLVWSLRLINPW